MMRKNIATGGNMMGMRKNIALYMGIGIFVAGVILTIILSSLPNLKIIGEIKRIEDTERGVVCYLHPDNGIWCYRDEL